MSKDFGIDILQPTQGGGYNATGPVAQRLLSSGMNVNALRTCDVLRKEEWLAFDQAVVEVARKRLVGVGALMERGLTFNVSNALGTTQLQWETMSDMEPADLSMSGVTEGERDRLEFALKTLPLPIIHKDFNVNIRALEASRRLGQSMDTAQAGLAGRLVSEKVEELLFLGSNIAVLGDSIPGLTTQADRNTGSLTAGTSTAWDAGTAGTAKVTDVISMIDALAADNMFGPYGLFISQGMFNLLADDYKTNSDKTQLQRINEISGIEFVLPSKDIPDGTAVLVQLSRDVIEEVVGMQPTTIQWSSNGGMTVNFKVMAIMVPRVRSTQTAQSGVAHFTG